MSCYFDRNPVGRLVTRVTTDVDVLNDLFASGLVTIIGDLLALSFIVAMMFRLSPGMAGFHAGRFAAGRFGNNEIPQDSGAKFPAHSRGQWPRSIRICKNMLPA